MNILNAFFFVLSCSIDCLVVSIAYGVKGINVSKSSNFVISIISAIGTFISMEFGLLISKAFPNLITLNIGNILLLLMGLYFLYDGLKDYFLYKNKDSLLDSPEKADKDCSGNIDLKESIFLSLALTLNNFILGIAASISGFNPLTTSIIALFCTFILISLGLFLGKKAVCSSLKKYTSIISGIIIIFLSLFQMFF